MEIECTSQELKELLNKETPVARTTDVIYSMNNTKFINELSKKMAKNLTNYDIHEESS